MKDDLNEETARYVEEKGAHLGWKLRAEVANAIHLYVKSLKLPPVPVAELHCTVFESYIPGFQIHTKPVYELVPRDTVQVTVRGSRTRPCVILFDSPDMRKRNAELSHIEDRVAHKRGLRLSQKFILNPHIKIIEYADPMKVNAELLEKMNLFFSKVPIIFDREYTNPRDLRSEQLPVQVLEPKELTPEENKRRISNSQQAQEYRDKGRRK